MGPELEGIEDIYIASVLQTGGGKQIVYVCQSVTNPVNHPPGDSTLFLADAKVMLSCDEWEVSLSPDSFDSLEAATMGCPLFFSTKDHNIYIEPEKTYELAVSWHGKRFTAQTITPKAPLFNPIDSVVVIHNDEFEPGEFELSWQSSYQKHWVKIDYPWSKSLQWGGSGRNNLYYFVEGHKAKFSTWSWDSAGVAIAVVFTWNDDYDQYLYSAEDLATTDVPHKRFSNIFGAHGIFAAMASDTLVFQYKKM